MILNYLLNFFSLMIGFISLAFTIKQSKKKD